MSEPFDAEDFIRRLIASGAEQQRIVALRPTAQQVSESLGAGADLLYRALSLLRQQHLLLLGQDPQAHSTWPPAASSRAADDCSEYESLVRDFIATHGPEGHHWLETNPLRNPLLWGTDHLRRALYTVTDCLGGIARLVGHDGHHLRAPIVLARTAFEVAAWGAFLIDPEIDRQERLRRTLNLQFAELKEMTNANPSRDLERNELDELVAFGEFAGFDVRYRPTRHYPPVIHRSGQKDPDSARHVIEQILPRVGRDMWRSLSAVAHGRDAPVLIPDEVAPPDQIVGWQRVQSIAWHTMPALLTTQEVCRHIEAYWGWETKEWADALHPLAVTLATAAGLHDPEIRAHLGLDSI